MQLSSALRLAEQADVYAAAGNQAQSAWWHTPVLAGLFALVGVFIAQSVALWLARRSERRRADPELLKQCASFSAAAGRLKRELTLYADDPDLSCIKDLDAASDAIDLIGTPEIESAVDKLIGTVPLALNPEAFNMDPEEAKRHLFQAHAAFTDAARKHFNKPPRVHVAVPMIHIDRRSNTEGASNEL